MSLSWSLTFWICAASAVCFMRLRQRGALLLFYQPNVCGTDIAVAIHIRAEVRAVDMLAL